VQVQLSHLGVDRDQASLFQRLAGPRALRGSVDASVFRRHTPWCGGPAALWTQGISGDIPIILVRIDNIEDVAIVRSLLRAHEYWRMKHLAVDLVILNERASSYIQDLQIALETLVRTSQSRPAVRSGRRRWLRVRAACRSHFGRDRALLLSMARARAGRTHGTLSEQLNHLRKRTRSQAPPRARAARGRVAGPSGTTEPWNSSTGLGGFAADAREYVRCSCRAVRCRPMDQCLANPSFGFQVASRAVATPGRSAVARTSSRPGRTTGRDRPGEVLYLRDEESGELWGTDGAADP